MEILEQLATRDEFLNMVYSKSNSHNSKTQAINAFKKWDRFLSTNFKHKQEFEIIAELKKSSTTPEFYRFLNRFVQQMVLEGISLSTIRSYFNQIKAWLRFNAIRIHNDDVKQFISFPKQYREIRKPIRMEEIKKLLDNTDNKTMKALIYTLVSSGMRLNEALQLKLSDVNDENGFVILRASTTKTRESRITRISNQALEAIIELPYDEFVFVDKWTKYSSGWFETQFQAMRRKAKLNDKYENGKMYTINIHSLRSFFFTQATKVLGGDIAHALIGHHAYLDQYFRLEDSEQEKLYEKLKPFVTIN